MNDERSFNDYFESLVLSSSCIDDAAEKLTIDDLKSICYFTDWDEEQILSEDKRNTIYLYALRLLFLYEERHSLFDFLHCLNPYLS